MIDLIGCKRGERFKNGLGQVVEVVDARFGFFLPWHDFRIYYQRVVGFALSGNSVGLHPDQFYKNYSKRVND